MFQGRRSGLQIHLGGFDSYPIRIRRKMEPVPDEYHDLVAKASEQLSKAAKDVMWVAEMLGNDRYELETTDGYIINITKRPDGQLVPTEEPGGHLIPK